jgi:hypothetical protein
MADNARHHHLRLARNNGLRCSWPKDASGNYEIVYEGDTSGHGRPIDVPRSTLECSTNSLVRMIAVSPDVC